MSRRRSYTEAELCGLRQASYARSWQQAQEVLTRRRVFAQIAEIEQAMLPAEQRGVAIVLYDAAFARRQADCEMARQNREHADFQHCLKQRFARLRELVSKIPR